VVARLARELEARRLAAASDEVALSSGNLVRKGFGRSSRFTMRSSPASSPICVRLG